MLLRLDAVLIVANAVVAQALGAKVNVGDVCVLAIEDAGNLLKSRATVNCVSKTIE